jgi:pyruvate/2-oxoglutarate dehydrogenase complex dihydrolipoamide acyltransferase (E2) component
MKQRSEIRLPELGLDQAHVTVSVWLVEVGAEVVAGDRLLQLVAGEVSLDIPAPATGRIVEQTVVETEEVTTGQLLGVIEAEASPDAG